MQQNIVFYCIKIIDQIFWYAFDTDQCFFFENISFLLSISKFINCYTHCSQYITIFVLYKNKIKFYISIANLNKITLQK